MLKIVKERLLRIINHYGYDSQSRQLIEEMGELTQAINKFWRKQLKRGRIMFDDVPTGTPEERRIIEEIADVEVCLEQIKMFFQCKQAVEKEKGIKILRQIDRIEKERAENETTEVF